MAPSITSTAPATALPSKASNQRNGAAVEQSDAGAAPIIDLYSGSQASMAITDAALRSDIIAGLRGRDTFIVPGSVDNEDDRRFAFRRTLPTTILYSERGLLLYDKLVEAPEYYLWNAEIDILKRYADEIAHRAFGYKVPERKEQVHDDEPERKEEAPPPPPPKYQNGSAPTDNDINEKWGDDRVGIHNGGVNAEEGLDGERAYNAAASSLVELGAGSLRKTVHLIRALKGLPSVHAADGAAMRAAAAADTTPKVQYYALDLDKAELGRTLNDLHEQAAEPRDAKHWTVLDGTVGINGMWATYEQGLEFIGEGGLAKSQGVPEDGKRCLLWLGSSIGNFDRRGAAEFLQRAASSALRAGDTMLVSIDRRNEPQAIAEAYNDAEGRTRDFIIQGLHHADKILGGENGSVLDPSKFEYFDRYNAVEGRHESYYRVLDDVEISVPGESESIKLDAGELIHVESSYKYNEREAVDIFDFAGLRIVNRWTDINERYNIFLVERPAFHFCSTRLLTGSRQDIDRGLSVAESNGLRGSWEFDSDAGAGSTSIKTPVVHASWGMPTRADWKQLWMAWDTVTQTMIPEEMLHVKPIDLRHICLFYVGHIPTFLDIFLSRSLNEPHTNEHYSEIFERGIDPHLDDLSQCNPHSVVPTRKEDWPTLPELMAYKGKVMARVERLYDDIATGKRALDRRLARVLWLTLEHKALHLETLLYMLLQSDMTLAPKGFIAPDWQVLARQWDAADDAQGGQEAREELLNFKPAFVTLGHDDDEALDFDFVAPRASADVADLNAQLGHPEFGWDIEAPPQRFKTGAFSVMAAPINNEQFLRFLEATQSSDYPLSWIVNGKDVRVRTFYGPVGMHVARLWPCIASATQLERYASWKGGRLPTQAELRRFLDADSGPNCTDRPGTNVGFRNWHPVPSQLSKQDHDGTVLCGHNGGVWEWTGTALNKHDGYKSSTLYPGYSSDFFDEKHNVVLGGSYCTTPSIAGRRSVVNWYQKAYPYVFASARVVFDATTKTRARTPSPHVERSPRGNSVSRFTST